MNSQEQRCFELRLLTSGFCRFKRDSARALLFSTIFTYLIVTIAVLILSAVGKPLEGFQAYYYSFSTVAAVAIGFYTGTTSNKNAKGDKGEPLK